MSTYYARHPAEFYERSPEPMFSEPYNPDVALLHLLASSAESGISEGELSEFELGVLAELESRGGLAEVRGGGGCGRRPPAGRRWRTSSR